MGGSNDFFLRLAQLENTALDADRQATIQTPVLSLAATSGIRSVRLSGEGLSGNEAHVFNHRNSYRLRRGTGRLHDGKRACCCTYAALRICDYWRRSDRHNARG